MSSFLTSSLLPWILSSFIGTTPDLSNTVSDAIKKRPTVSITKLNQVAISHPKGIVIQITFSRSVSNFQANDIYVVNGKISNFSGRKKIYTAEVIPIGPALGVPPQPSQEAIIQVSVPAEVARHLLGGGNLASSVFTYHPASTTIAAAPTPPPKPPVVAPTVRPPAIAPTVRPPAIAQEKPADTIANDLSAKVQSIDIDIGPSLPAFYKMAETTANKSEHIVLALQGGPVFTLGYLDEFSKNLEDEEQIGSFASLHENLNIAYVHQAQTISELKWAHAHFNLDQEDGKLAANTSVDFLHKTILHFTKEGKKISILSHSYGTLLALLYLKKYGNKALHKMVLISEEGKNPLSNVDLNYKETFKHLVLSNLLFLVTTKNQVRSEETMEEQLFLNSRDTILLNSLELWSEPANKKQILKFLN